MAPATSTLPGDGSLTDTDEPLDEPLDGVVERDVDRRLGQAQRADGLGRAEVHPLPRHADGRERHPRGATTEARRAFHAERGQPRGGVGDAEARGRDAGDPGQPPEDLQQRQVLVAEDVPVAHAPAVGGEDMPAGDVAHVDEVESRVERGHHPAPEKIHDHLPRRGRLDIPVADGRRGVDGDDRSPARRQLLSHPLGQELGGLVGPHHVVERRRRGLVARRPVLGNAHGADGRRVDDALGAGLAGRLQDVAGAVHIGPVERPRIGRPEPVIGRDMVDAPHPAHRGPDGRRVQQVAFHHLHRASLEGPPVPALARENAHAPAVGQELAHEVGADEAGAAGDERVHRDLPDQRRQHARDGAEGLVGSPPELERSLERRRTRDRHGQRAGEPEPAFRRDQTGELGGQALPRAVRDGADHERRASGGGGARHEDGGFHVGRHRAAGGEERGLGLGRRDDLPGRDQRAGADRRAGAGHRHAMVSGGDRVRLAGRVDHAIGDDEVAGLEARIEPSTHARRDDQRGSEPIQQGGPA